MSNDGPLTYEELTRIINRGQEAKRILIERIGALEGERSELLAIVHELQSDLAASRQSAEHFALQLATIDQTSTDPNLTAPNGAITPVRAPVQSG